MDINGLFTDKGMRDFTSDIREQGLKDAREFGQLADIIRRRLEQTPVDGDGRFSAKWRARKVSRLMRAMERDAQRIASSAEALYAKYHNDVLELPARRQRALESKDQRKTNRQVTAGAVVAKSLQKSAGTLHGAADPAVPHARQPEFLDAQAWQHPMAAGGEDQQTLAVSDFFQGKRQ